MTGVGDPRNPTTVLNVDPRRFQQNDDENKEFEDELNEFKNMNFLCYTAKYAWKTQLWLFILIAFCVMRAANSFTLWMAYLILFLRSLQMVALMTGKRMYGEAVYAFIVFFHFMLFFAEFASESADIVHEVIPVESTTNIYSLEYMRYNYNPCGGASDC